MLMSDYIFSPEASAPCPAALGAKAQGLWHLQQADLPVPVWWGVLSSLFQVYLKQAGLGPEQLKAAWLEGPEAWGALKSVCLASGADGSDFNTLVSELVSEHLSEFGDRAWAIRSSSSWEDQGKQSFAGLFETSFLGAPEETEALEQRVEALVTALQFCWLSAFTEPVWLYGHKHALEPEDLQMAVILQELKAPQTSGVWFDTHPQGPWHEALLIAGYGLGEGIVQNQVETDSWVYHRGKKSWRVTVAAKSHRAVMNSDGLGYQAMPIQTEPCLSQELLDQFVNWIEQHNAYFKTPQDIEWCHDQNGFWFLQSRPITTLPPGPPLFLDASNIGESYPGVISPLTFSVVRRGYATNFYYTLALLGMPTQLLQAYRPRLNQLVALVGGRIYYNLGQWQALLALLPGLGKRAQLSFAEMIGSLSVSPNATEKPLRFWRVYPRLILSLGHFSFRLKHFCRRLEALLVTFEKTPLKAQSSGELILFYQAQFDTIVSRLAPGLINDLWLSLCISLTRTYFLNLSPREPLQAEEAWSQLLAGISDLPSKDALYELLRLLPMLDSEPQLYSGLELRVQQGENPETWLALAWPQWHGEVQKYLEHYGFRVSQEFLLEHPSFVQEPLKLYQWLLQLAQQGLSAEKVKAQERALQAQAQRVLLHFSWSQRCVLRFLLQRCYQALRRREQVRLFRARMMSAARRFFLELADRFKAQSLLSAVEDVFYLTEEEIIDLAQQQAFMSPQQVIHERKQAALKYLQQDPGTYYACFAPYFPLALAQASEPVLNTSDQTLFWHGQGCGGGIIQGELLVTDSPPAAHESRDKILVVAATDPGWMLHLLQCCGLIAEQGNLLSHAAILGRELGLPTVVGIPGMRQVLKTGQWVELNGLSGEVRLLSHPSPGG